MKTFIPEIWAPVIKEYYMPEEKDLFPGKVWKTGPGYGDQEFVKCPQCGWDGYESQLYWDPRGYPECPVCKNEEWKFAETE